MKIIDDEGQVIAEGHTLTLEPGDIVVFQAKRFLSMADREGIKGLLEKVFPGKEAAILHDGDEIGILRHRVEVSA